MLPLVPGATCFSVVRLPSIFIIFPRFFRRTEGCLSAPKCLRNAVNFCQQCLRSMSQKKCTSPKMLLNPHHNLGHCNHHETQDQTGTRKRTPADQRRMIIIYHKKSRSQQEKMGTQKCVRDLDVERRRDQRRRAANTAEVEAEKHFGARQDDVRCNASACCLDKQTISSTIKQQPAYSCGSAVQRH